jgi:LmbE family N-acetylglucosaminyl deacetylase
VLAIGAHPDDLELLCSGTLARFLDLGVAVELAVACRGDRGGSIGPDPDLADRRRSEAEAAARVLGVPIRFLEFGDSDLYDSPESRARFVGLLRESRPDLVITHPPEDYHADHVRVGELAGMACWFAASGGWVVGDLPPLETPPSLVFMDTIAAVGFEPTQYVDISATIDRKRRMFECHASQAAREDGGIHALAELLEVQARLRGFQCGARYAEAFRTAPLWGRMRAGPLLP